ncbi:hypothetical protein TVAG_447780 [Trichomonas vaginalis G3]|uniref:Uncharacterized protein n=1 Tax=Trichomonas vaginalis (strain ATCC PRA-98 / G3) TaxID=412133 RepID=A2DS49_TRIV3|nr:hypothetical protein TVAGG3_1000620 [Trichomonas vaginalis G3]EAY16819.1 hypothetical protein TVAG_447780 [Trichomonas vaginalis G3]KAI5490770.1 hypothetical protein TVAGG3_1000620 [Trichomonas vaginalis G3]|eukprot:XP_001329042.1 hypothetical protein [Trichomonas vaginalis G3]
MQQRFEDNIQQLIAKYNESPSFEAKQKLAIKTFKACHDVSDRLPTELNKFIKRVVPRDTRKYDRRAVEELVNQHENHGIKNSPSYQLIQRHMGYTTQNTPIILLYGLLKLVPNRVSNSRVFKDQSAIYTELDRHLDWLTEYIRNAEMGGIKILQYN